MSKLFQNVSPQEGKQYRVIVWGTGGVGSHSIRAIAKRPNLKLVGVWVHREEKVGRDAGALVGIEPLGVIATGDADAIIKMDADCVCYAGAGSDTGKIKECIDDYCRILESGKNIVSTSVPALVYPKAFDSSMVKRLEAACEAGSSSLFVSGMEPGFAGDFFPLALLTMSDRITSVRAIEIGDYRDYPVDFLMRRVWGYGQPPDYQPLICRPGNLTRSWGPSILMVADALGVQLDEIREKTHKPEVTEMKLEIAVGTIAPGTIAAIRFETVGVVNGREAIIIEHVNRISSDVALDWPSAAHPLTYRVIIEGKPNITCDFQFGFLHQGDDPSDHGMIGTAMRIVNAIPAVCEAKRGLLSALDLPLTVPQQAFDSTHPIKSFD